MYVCKDSAAPAHARTRAHRPAAPRSLCRPVQADGGWRAVCYGAPTSERGKMVERGEASSLAVRLRGSTPHPPPPPPCSRLAAALWALHASALHELGRPVEALNACGTSLRLLPTQPRAWFLRPVLAAPALRAALRPKEGDVFIATYPKSGTTWCSFLFNMGPYLINCRIMNYNVL